MIIGKYLTRKFINYPIFVVGDGRSGTSVLLQALGKHPLILSMPGEAPLITSMGAIISRLELTDDTKREYYKNALKFDKTYLYEHLQRLSFEIAGGKNYALRMLMKNLLPNPSLLMRKRYWAAKTFPNENIANGLMKLYPKAKFIYIIRNGIDVVQSKTRFSGFRDNDFRQHCEQKSSPQTTNFSQTILSVTPILMRNQKSDAH